MVLLQFVFFLFPVSICFAFLNYLERDAAIIVVFAVSNLDYIQEAVE